MSAKLNYETWPFPFGKWKGKTLAEIPTSYLDWLIGEDWFIKSERNAPWLVAIGQELDTRRRSGGYKPEAEQDEDWEYENRYKRRDE